ncbi:putative bithoraxoid-like protein [Scenedesmus sp. NREL 46B-D3]|nr:putative bithoraxoid-like protein [Scenedesmus sp. NREL 46B-D3]
MAISCSGNMLYSQSLVQDTLERIEKLKEQLTQDYASMIPSLTALARNMVRELDPQNDMEFLRVRSAKHEVMVAPKGDYVLIVIQDAAS